MASVGTDQFWDGYKPEDNTVTPKKKKLVAYSQTSSMSSPQSTSVTRTAGVTSTGLQGAARRKMKKLQQQQDTDYRF